MFFRPKTEKYMKRILLLSLSFWFLATVFPGKISDAILVTDNSSEIDTEIIKPDPRVIQLKAYLKSHNSPLTDYADVFVTKADEYGLPDWRLVPAITGVESTFGKAIPANSYNAYGWANGAYSFKSWEESIDHVTKTLKTRYIDRGADTVEKIAPIYAPPSQTWAGKVRFFMDKISTFSSSDPKNLSLTL